jgi:hypothetical protein
MENNLSYGHFLISLNRSVVILWYIIIDKYAIVLTLSRIMDSTNDYTSSQNIIFSAFNYMAYFLVAGPNFLSLYIYSK